MATAGSCRRSRRGRRADERPEPLRESVLAAELRKTEAAHLAQQEASGTGSSGRSGTRTGSRGPSATRTVYEDLLTALNAAATAHGTYETEELGGVRTRTGPSGMRRTWPRLLSGARQRFAANGLEALEDWARAAPRAP